MIIWTEKYETGSAKLDQQHRILIDNINLLEDLLQSPVLSGEETEFAVQLVEYLEAYANLHFRAEEKCMESYRCPVHAKNQQEHERFRSFLMDYKRVYLKEGFKVELLKSLHGVIQSWINVHILKIDTQLKPCISGQH